MNPVQPLSAYDVATRFKRSVRWAGLRIREMRHVGDGDDLYTTEEWLAEWMAAEAVPAMNWPPPGEPLDPLEEAVCARVIAMVGRLAREGKVQVVGG